MKMPTEPKKPYPPYKRHLSTEVREQVGPYDEDDEEHTVYCDGPQYPTLTIKFLKKWAKRNGVAPKAVTVELHAGSHEYEMILKAPRPITKEMREEVERDYQEELTLHNEITLPAYEKALAEYNIDIRAYYQWRARA
jgi:hypothetical protein